LSLLLYICFFLTV